MRRVVTLVVVGIFLSFNKSTPPHIFCLLLNGVSGIVIGSIVVYPYDDPSYPAVELGASIFVDANRNMMRAVKEFNLTLAPFRKGEDDSDMGIWDGSRFVLRVILFHTTNVACQLLIPL